MLHSVPLAMGFQGRIQVFKLGGTHLIKLRRAEGSANIFGVFRVKNYDFTPKNHIFSNSRGRRENFWGISCEKSRFYDKKSYFFPILGGAHLKKLRRAEGGAKMFGVFRVKNHDLTPKNHIVSNFREGARPPGSAPG